MNKQEPVSSVTDEWLDDEAAAAFLGRSARYMRSLRERRLVRYYKVGRRPLWRLSDLAAFRESHPVEPELDPASQLRVTPQRRRGAA